MTSTVTREPNDMAHANIRVTCDHIGCEKTVTDTEITAGGGLRKMGWTTAAFDKKLHHYCPEHTR